MHMECMYVSTLGIKSMELMERVRTKLLCFGKNVVFLCHVLEIYFW